MFKGDATGSRIIMAIKELLKRDWLVYIMHNYRQVNKCANCLVFLLLAEGSKSEMILLVFLLVYWLMIVD